MTKNITLPAHDIVCNLLSDETSEKDREVLFNELIAQPITTELLVEGVKALREHMKKTPLDITRTIDTCGTGGSGKQTINTSTLTAFIVAAAGGKVAKHGNRSASGNCGCFDVLEKLGVKIDLTPEEEVNVFDHLGIAFLFAPLHHPSLRHVGPLRKAHGKKTVFNLMGPLCNPAGVMRQMIGTGSHKQAEIIADTLNALGIEKAIIVRGEDGLDEVTTTADTNVYIVKDGKVIQEKFSPEQYGIPLASEKDIEGGAPEENVELFLEIAKGKGSEAMKNLVIVNAAHGLHMTSKVDNIEEALTLARSILESGAAFDLFEQYKAYTSADHD